MYPHWYYGGIINEMENINDKFKYKKTKIQEHLSPYINKPGIAFSFDDSFRVNQWYKYGKEMLGYYDVKVTFNINAFHHFEGQREHTQEEIDLLLELQANGHEIAHHGYKHQNANQYSIEHGLSNWIEDEIKPLFHWMENQAHSKTNEKFKQTVSFALPYSEYTEEHIKELIPKYYKIVRGHLFEDNLIPFNYTGFAPSICVDSKFLKDIKYIKKIMKMAKKTGNNLIFMCHSIIPEEINWMDFGLGEDAMEAGEWRISPNTLQAIIQEAKKIDMEFYTTSEIAGVATFIDKDLENCVRGLISNKTTQWIPISDLSSIKELDLRSKNISNLDGIQYFTNLEKLYLNDNNISNLKLTERLPKLKEIDFLPQ